MERFSYLGVITNHEIAEKVCSSGDQSPDKQWRRINPDWSPAKPGFFLIARCFSTVREVFSVPCQGAYSPPQAKALCCRLVSAKL